MIYQDARKRNRVGISAATTDTLDRLKPLAVLIAATGPTRDEVGEARAEIGRLGAIHPMVDPTEYMHTLPLVQAWEDFMRAYDKIADSATKLRVELIKLGPADDV